jgi:hypothetical protein
MNQHEYISAMSQLVKGVTVMTAISSYGLIGITANSFSSVLLEPPFVLWSIAINSKKFQTTTSVKNYVIHILSDRQKNIVMKFSGKSLVQNQIDLWLGFLVFPLLIGQLQCFSVSVSVSVRVYMSGYLFCSYRVSKVCKK